MKKRLLPLLMFVFLLVPCMGFSIIFLKIDEKGNHFYACEGASGHALSIKLIDKNTYKILGTNIGKVVTANSESEAAQIICGEGIGSIKKKDG